MRLDPHGQTYGLLTGAELPVMTTIYLRQDWEEEMCKISGDSTAHYRAGEQSSLDIKNRTSIFQEDPPEGILNVFCPDTNDVAQKKKNAIK